MSATPSLFNDLVQILRESYPCTAVKDGNAIARFIGWQQTIDPTKPLALFNVIVPIFGKPAHGTICASTFTANSYSIPSTAVIYKATLVDGEIVYVPANKPTEQRADIYDSRSFDDNLEPLCTA